LDLEDRNSTQQMTPTLRFRVIYERNYVIEHGDVFFCLMPYK